MALRGWPRNLSRSLRVLGAPGRSFGSSIWIVKLMHSGDIKLYLGIRIFFFSIVMQILHNMQHASNICMCSQIHITEWHVRLGKKIPTWKQMLNGRLCAIYSTVNTNPASMNRTFLLSLIHSISVGRSTVLMRIFATCCFALCQLVIRDSLNELIKS